MKLYRRYTLAPYSTAKMTESCWQMKATFLTLDWDMEIPFRAFTCKKKRRHSFQMPSITKWFAGVTFFFPQHLLFQKTTQHLLPAFIWTLIFSSASGVTLSTRFNAKSICSAKLVTKAVNSWRFRGTRDRYRPKNGGFSPSFLSHQEVNKPFQNM